jgi:diguanylate cyclase (GGDEF)-like protein/PAS domain S-box-containing protein
MPDLSRDVASLSARPLDTVLDAAATLMAVVTPDGTIAYRNRAWQRLSDPRAVTLFDVIPEREHFAAREALGRAAGGEPKVEVELSFRTGAGELRPVAWTHTPLAGADGPPTHVVASGVDATEREEFDERLRDLVDIDALTGLITRHRFEQELERHVAHGRRYGMTGALIVLDLDGFRTINEDHGPRAGDRVLMRVADALTNRLRETDLLARIGGDQFAVLLPRAGQPEAERVCQALEEAIPAEVQLSGERRLEASVGFAPFSQTMTSAEEVLLAADAAMYAVKAGQPRRFRRLRPLD